MKCREGITAVNVTIDYDFLLLTPLIMSVYIADLCHFLSLLLMPSI